MTSLSTTTDSALPLRPIFTPPYPRSWVDALDDWAERVPGGPWSFYLVFLAFFVFVTNAQNWLDGAPVGSFSPQASSYGIYPVYALVLLHYLDRVAIGALAAFEPALEASADELARLRYELTTVPARAGALATGLVALLVVVGYVADPVGSGIAGHNSAYQIASVAGDAFGSSIFGVVFLHIFRQLRLVSRIHAMAPHLDLFAPAPLYAFSKLTANTGIGILVVVAFSALTQGRVGDSIVYLGWTLGPAGLAITCFVLPLYGMHRRLVVEKRQLQNAADSRVKATIADLHRSVDERDRTVADGISKAMASLVQEREVLAKLGTWPWQMGTLGTFVSAVILPVGLWLLFRLLSNVV